MFVSFAKNFLRRAPLSARATAPSILSRAFASDGLEAFGRNKFFGDVADEFLKPHGMSWADMEDGTWTTDMAKADKVKYRTLKRRVAFYFNFSEVAMFRDIFSLLRGGLLPIHSNFSFVAAIMPSNLLTPQ